MEVKGSTEGLNAPLLSASSSTFIWMEPSREKFVAEEAQEEEEGQEDYLYSFEDDMNEDDSPLAASDLLDCANYFKILFPYASSNQISKVIHLPHVHTLQDAATILYRELNPQNDVQYMLQEERRCRWEHRNGLPTNLLDGVSTAWKRRLDRLQDCDDGVFPPVSEMGLYESCVHVLPVDTSAWDEEMLLEEGCMGFKYDDLPLTAYTDPSATGLSSLAGCSPRQGGGGGGGGGGVNRRERRRTWSAQRMTHSDLVRSSRSVSPTVYSSAIRQDAKNAGWRREGDNDEDAEDAGDASSDRGVSDNVKAEPPAGLPTTTTTASCRLEEGVAFLEQTTLTAPIVRWAPDIAIMVPGTPSSAGTETATTDDLFYINGIERRCSFLVVPKEMMLSTTSLPHEPFADVASDSPLPPQDAAGVMKRNEYYEKENGSVGGGIGVPMEEASDDASPGFDLLTVLTNEKRRFEACLTLLQPYADIFGTKERCNLIKTISVYAPTAKSLLPQQIHKIVHLLPVLATKDVLTRGFSDMPIRLPVLGKKLVTLGPISIRELQLAEKGEAAELKFGEDNTKVEVKLKIKKVSLKPVPFSYISQSDAAKQLFHDNYIDPRRGVETNVVGPRPFSGAKTGVADVTVGNVKVKGYLRMSVYSSGNVDMRVEEPKVSIGSLTISSSLTRINVLSALLKPVLKCAIASAIEEALRGGTLP